MEDAPGAAAALASARGQAASGNLDTAARVAQSLLTSNAERLTVSGEGDELMVPVRDRVHALLRSDAALLERYRQIESAEAERLLEIGALERVERERFLTPAGREAALRLAQLRLESAHFHAALRLLEAVDGHPDQRGARDGAGGVAAQLARYLPAAGALAEKWAVESGERGVDGARVTGPVIVTARSGYDPAPALDIGAVIEEPIRSRSFGDGARGASGLLGAGPVSVRSRRGGRTQVDPARTVVPAVAGDLLLICDGAAVRALDRFTLEERWRLETGAAGRREVPVRVTGSGGPHTVGVWGGTAVAATTATANRQSLGDGQVHAIDIDSGERRWATLLSGLDAGLSSTQPTGAVVAAEGLAVVAASRRVREQRLDSAVLVALRLSDGELVWKRTVASAGSLPQAMQGGGGAVPVIADGVVYYSEPLGAIAAVELATGRFLWVRRARPVDRATPPSRLLWATRPVVRDGVVYAIEPDGARVLALDARTGALIAERDENDFGVPGALLAVGEHLVSSSERELRAVRFASFADGAVEPETVFTSESGWFEGRAIATGDFVLAATGTGYTLVDPARPGEVVGEIGFGNTGNAVVSGAQLAALDGAGVSSYLVWEAAREALESRMASSPADAAPAVTLAELAHKAGREQAIVPAVDAALEALRTEARSARASATRGRLFKAIDGMIDASGGGDGVELGDVTLGALIGRLGQAASTAEESALHQLRAGAFAESGGRAGEAVAAYQRVLDDAALRRVSVELGSRVVGARTESTRRLRRLVEIEGAGLYGVFEGEARRALELAQGSGDPERFAEIARRYPVAEAALDAWLAASDAALGRGRLRGSIAYLEEALAAADGVPGARDEVVGEIVGRLATRLVEGGRAAAASAVLARTAQERPLLALTNRGALVDLIALRAEIAETRTRLPRRAAVGELASGALGSISNRLALRPLFSSLDSDHSMVLLAGEDEVEAWEADPAGGLRRRAGWNAEFDPAMSLLRLDSVGAVVSLGYDEERRLARLNGRTGETVWETAPFVSAFPEGTAPDPGETVALPAGGVRPRGEVLVAVRDDWAALVERSGRVAGYDVAEGRLLWARDVGVEQVHDAAESGGLLVVVGANQRDEAGARLSLKPAGVVVDLASGREVGSLELGEARARWVRATRDGVALVGADRGIFAFDLTTGELLWANTEGAARRTVEAWSFPGRLITLEAGGTLWQVEVESGGLRETALETRGRLDGGVTNIEAAAAGDSAVLALPQGLAIYNRRGELVGVDHRSAQTTAGPLAFGENVAVMVEPRGFEPRLYEVRVVGLDSGRLLQSVVVELPARPHSVDLIDGRVLIGAGGGVVTLDAPLE